MKQRSFADAEYAGKRKQTRRERFLTEMDQVVPWQALMALIERCYPRGEGGRPATRWLPCEGEAPGKCP
ncbi:transposase, IS5 family [Pseudomonas oryzae]|uniref:Transposase, IS5 family n=1 Tax=Pseudomonas oryzae TaxID=1392877 RepID=A0A1H1QU94_9PSED|nr:transposase, IS5 family [Pseudomonas oryzae]